MILEEKKESNVAQTKINLQWFQFISNSYCMSLVALIRSPPALFLVILWCRGGLSYKSGGRSSPNNMLYSVKFILILRRINGHDDNDEFKKYQLSLFFLFFCFFGSLFVKTSHKLWGTVQTVTLSA